MTTPELLRDRMERDPVYRSGREFLTRATADPDALAHRVAFAVLSPLGLQSGRAPVAIRWFRANGFTVHFVRSIRLTADTVRVLWAYQPSVADPARNRIFADVMTWREALFLGVSTAGTPCAAVLRERKGPSDPRKARAEHLRSALGAANIFNNLVHTPDGPRDVVREARALLDDRDLADFWRLALSPPGTVTPFEAPLLPVTALRPAVLRRRELLSGPRVAPAAQAEADRQVAWLATVDPLRSVDSYREFRRLFGVPVLGHPVADELGKVLRGEPFDLDALSSGAMEPRDRVILASEWLSRRYET